ncbi:hypothetical protein [Streptomyces sp. AK02-04a]|uniref:hypothetical protein n=1 Tax=Streptomyces sp. AK02-04a TaxID=3028649 RepID=UPI0029A8285B|nr:hypothetical protein [Streptomyces sp. AK02-04a]MDX3763308.1 hypothetical protein [Streptomyces sp. AK02-04a]
MSVVSLAAAPSSAADEHDRPMPKAQAFDGDKALSSVKDVTDLCSQGKGCRFVVDAVQEYRGGVISVGNAFLNCTDHDIDVERYASLQPRITDNIGGDLSGRATNRGTINNSSQVEASGTATGSESVLVGRSTWNNEMQESTAKSDNESTTEGRLSGTMSGQSTGSKAADQSFENSANRTYSRTWDNSVRSTTRIDATAPAGDVLTWGYVEMGHRVTGTLKAVGTSKYVKDVVVDEPSILESSSFVAQTYTAPKGACLDTRPITRAAKQATLSSPLRATKSTKSTKSTKPETPGVLQARRK